MSRSRLFISAQGCLFPLKRVYFRSRLFISAQGCLFPLRAVYFRSGLFWLKAVYLAQGCFLAQGCLFRSSCLFPLKAVYFRSRLFIWLKAVYFRSRLFFGSGLSRVGHPPDERLSPPKTANLALEHLILQPLSSARDGPSKSHKGWAQIFIAPLPPRKNALASPSKSLMGH